MDHLGPDNSAEGLFEGNAPPSPSPAPRQPYPTSPKDLHMSSNLVFRPPPRPGSSLRKGRKSDFNTPAPPPLPSHSLHNEYRALVDATNLTASKSADAPPRSSSSASMHRDPSEQISASASTKAIDMARLARERLQVLRQENESQVNSAGLLGQGLLELRTKIESLMDEMADELSAAEDVSDHSSAGAQGNSARIRVLGERIEAEIEELEQQKRKLFSEITVHNVDMSNGDVGEVSILSFGETPSKATRVANAIRNLTATPGKSPASSHSNGASAGGTGSTPRQGGDRRSRNAAARQTQADTGLINEIQAGLVQEVRRLQGLLKERDDQRNALERAHTELEKQLDQYKPRVIQMTEAEDALKQENWDLNVAKQNLEEQLGEINATLKKAELENLRLTKEVGKARETVDSQRLQIDGHVAEIERLVKARDTDTALARREKAGMQRDVSDLQSELQKFRAAQLQERGGVSRSVSNSFMSDVTNDDGTAGDDADAITARLRAAAGETPRSPGESLYSADGAALSPLGNRLGRDKEAQDLRAKLAMAQRKAGKDAAEKRRVREKNAELKKLLVQAGVKVPQGLDDDAETSEDEELHWMDDINATNASSPSAKRLSQIRAGRGNNSHLRPPRLGRRMGMVSSRSTDSIVEYGEYEDDEDDNTASRDASVAPSSPADASTSRASLEGMDPAFVDMFRNETTGNASVDSSTNGAGSRTAGAAGRGHRSRPSIGSSPLARQTLLPEGENEEEESPSAQRVLPKSGRRSGATVRASSSVYGPGALGSELGGFAAELAEAEQQAQEYDDVQLPEREMEDSAAQTDDLPDLVGPALAERDAQHAAAVEVVHATHAAKVAELSQQHDQALDALRQTHSGEVESLRAEHARALDERDQSNAKNLAASLAERTKIHEAALAEARSRHSNALAEQVAASSAALAAAIAQHKTSSEDLERKHREERERKEASHNFALGQRDRQHAEAVKTLEDSHVALLDGVRTEHAQTLAIREKALEDADAELARHKQEAQAAAEAAASAATEARSKHDAELATLREKHAGELTETETKHAAELAALRESHAGELAGAQSKHAADLEALRGSHAEELGEAQSKHATELATLRESHAVELGGAKASHAAEFETLRNSHAEELARSQAQLDNARAEIDRLQHTVASLKEELERLRKQGLEQEQAQKTLETELDETRSQLTMVQDKVRRHEEAASELTRQREAEAAAAAAAVAARSEALTATEAEKEQLSAAHALALAQKERQHHDAVKALEDSHTASVSQLRGEHKQVLATRDASVQEHREEAGKLREKVETLESQLEQLKQQSLTQQQTRDTTEKQLNAAVLQHSETAKELQTKVATLEAQLVQLQQDGSQHQQSREASEKQLNATIQEHRDEAKNLRNKVSALEVQLAKLEQEGTAQQQSRSDAEKQLGDSRAAHAQLQKSHDEAKSSVAALQSKVRYLESAIAAEKSSTEQSRLASDKELQTIQSALNTAQKRVREQEAAIAKAEAAAAAAATAAATLTELQAELQAKSEAVNDHDQAYDTETEAYEDAVEVVASPRAAKIASKPASAVPVEHKDTACQTDDEAWTRFQQQQRAMITPAEVATTAPQGDTLVGAGGVMILGGLRADTSRPRDSVSTFGGARDGGLRAESPAPAMYSADAFVGTTNNANAGQQGGRRKSTDSTWSRFTDRTTGEAIPPVPPLPDKTKPPVMSMPPPPTMPPPPSVTAKRTSLGGNAAAPPRPTSPPPADLLTRAQQRHLQIPAGGSGGEPLRSVSRASTRSGPPPSSYPANSQRVRQQSAGTTTGSIRSRTYSGEASPSAATALDASIYNGITSGGRKSIGSRKSAGVAARRPPVGPRQSSAASFVSDVTSEVSRRLSMMSSRASDADGDADAGDETFVVRPGASGPKGGVRGLSEFGGAESTDPAIIHAITQTMIGEYMFKYTRKSMGRGGHSDKRHKRYFWLHPYTKTLYWTISDPGGAKVSEGTSKSASIEAVRVVEDSNPSPPGLHHESLIITTASREVKISAPSRERHEAWLAALEYLVHRPTIQDATVIAGNAAPDLLSDVENDPATLTRSLGQRRRSRTSGTVSSRKPSRLLTPQRSFLSNRSSDAYAGGSSAMRVESSTPRQRQGSSGAGSVLYPSLGKRRDTAAHQYLQQHEYDREMSISMSPSSSIRRGIYPQSVRSRGDDESYDLLDLTATQSPLRRALAEDDPRLKTAEQMLEEDEPEGWDGLTNVRACCDGKHDVGSLAHDHHHGHHHAGSHRRDATGYSSDKGSRKSSRLHRRQSSGGSRFSSIGLKSKLDAAVRAAEERELQPAPRIPQTLLPSGAAAGTGAAAVADRESIDSARRPRTSDSSFANIFAPISSPTAPSSSGDHPNPSSNRTNQPAVGPSYGQRIQKIRKARLSAGASSAR
ncbi:hypothetical protein BCV70DRAFT_160991 [Testicularia cyperi]|uniref:PH domain-containing protein n=1 Tax=Testicularia cyperi TaxID=1882483 RepID=A0A317XPK2_9BASI|nr:hypothetical protein BCV70DRAFT_160991 [Testicularia cyperi]